MVKIRPRSLQRYSDAVKAKAREAFLDYSFIEKHFKESAAAKDVLSGKLDDYPMIELAAFLIDKRGEPAGVMCTGCGSNWSDERLAEEQRRRREDGRPLRSCCPERKMKPVYWCSDE